jgi:hypothetical protein
MAGTAGASCAQRNVHSLAWHPRVAGRAYEAAGGGSAFSEDADVTWRAADEGRDRHYTWSVAVDPEDPERWYLSASTGPYAAHRGRDPQARIYRRSAGEPWRALAGGLPEPLPAMPYALVAADGRLFAGLADGQLRASGDRGDTWAACRLRGDALRVLFALGQAGGWPTFQKASLECLKEDNCELMIVMSCHRWRSRRLFRAALCMCHRARAPIRSRSR